MKYTKETDQYIIDNYKTLDLVVTAEEIGVSLTALEKHISLLRNLGYDLPKRKRGNKAAVHGTTRLKTIGGVQYKQQKVGDRWLRIQRITPLSPRYKKREPNGSTKVESQKGVDYLKRKVQGKWVMVARLTPYKFTENAAMKKEHKVHVKAPPPPKKEPDRLPDKIVDQSVMKTVRVDKRTEIQVFKYIPDQQAIDEYYAKIERQRLHKHH